MFLYTFENIDKRLGNIIKLLRACLHVPTNFGTAVHPHHNGHRCAFQVSNISCSSSPVLMIAAALSPSTAVEHSLTRDVI